MKLLVPDLVEDAEISIGAPGRATAGMYVSEAGVPVERLGPAGRRFVQGLRAFAHVRGDVPPSTLGAAQAAEALLAAIARSDGTRSSVVARLAGGRVDGPLGPMRFDSSGDPTRATISIYRLRPGAPRRAQNNFRLPDEGAALDRVITPPADLVASIR